MPSFPLFFKFLWSIFVYNFFPIQPIISAAAVGMPIPVMLGGNVVLKCPSATSPSPEVTWMDPSNKVIATRGSLSASQAGRSKYVIVPGSPASTLIINDVGLGDDGVFWCRDADSYADLYSVNVIVLVSVQSIQLNGPSTDLNEGSQVNLTCVTDGSKPAPDIIWIKKDIDSAVLPTRLFGAVVDRDVVHANSTVRRTSQLTLAVDRSDYRATYTCRATVTSVAAFSREAVWSPAVLLSPMSPWLQSQQEKYSEGDTAHFQCVTSGSRPTATVTWFVHNQPITDLVGKVSSREKTDDDGTFSVSSGLDVTVSRDMNGADVTCSVTNSVLMSQGQESRNASITVQVQYKPTLSISSSASEIEGGDTVTFTCSTDAEPPVANDKLFLALNRKVLPTEKITKTGDKFILSNVSRFERGDYQCVGQNSLGSSSSPSTHLNVRFAPVCSFSDVRYIYVSLGEAVSIPCPVVAYPHDVSITWTRRSTNQTLRQDTAVKWSAQDIVRSEIQHTARNYEDILCYAKNGIGEATKPCVFRLKQPMLPASPDKCLVIALPNASHQIVCTPGSDGGSPLTFFLTVHGSNAQNDTVIYGKEPRFILDDLSSGGDFNLTVCALSQSYPDSPVCAGTLLYRPESQFLPPSSASEGEESTLYIILGTVFGCLFLVVLVVFIVLMRRHRKGRHSDRGPDGRDEAGIDSHRTPLNESSPEERTPTSGRHDDDDHHASRSRDHDHDDASRSRDARRHSARPQDAATTAAASDRSRLSTRRARPSSATDQTEQGRAGKKRDSTRQSLRASIVLTDSIRIQPSTRVYVKITDKKEKSQQESANEGRELGCGEQGSTEDNMLLPGDMKGLGSGSGYYLKSVLLAKTNRADAQRYPDYDKIRTPHRPGPGGPTRASEMKRTQSEDETEARQGRRNTSQQERVHSSATGNDQARISVPVDQAEFSDMIRQTLHRNRSALLSDSSPNELARQSRVLSPPLVSFLGSPHAHSPYSLCSPSSLSVSQTSLASDRLGSEIYDVPRNTCDWQRSMSLLSLSAIGSGVLSPDSEPKDGYIDMTKGPLGGSVPNNLDTLSRTRRQGGDESGNESESNYYMVPSNKHAYINMKYSRGGNTRDNTRPQRAQGDHKVSESKANGEDNVLSRKVNGEDNVLPRKTHGGDNVMPRKANGENNVLPRKANGEDNVLPRKVNGEDNVLPRKASGVDGTPRRWSSSEQKTHQLSSATLQTATLPPPSSAAASRPSALPPHPPGGQLSRMSMKLSPAPRLKLKPGRPPASLATSQGRLYKKRDSVHSPHGSSSAISVPPRTSSPKDVALGLNFGDVADTFNRAGDEESHRPSKIRPNLPHRGKLTLQAGLSQRTQSEDDSPSYVRMERNSGETLGDVFTFDETSIEKGGNTKAREEIQRPGVTGKRQQQQTSFSEGGPSRMSSVQRSPSYTHAVSPTASRGQDVGQSGSPEKSRSQNYTQAMIHKEPRSQNYTQPVNPKETRLPNHAQAANCKEPMRLSYVPSVSPKEPRIPNNAQAMNPK